MFLGSSELVQVFHQSSASSQYFLCRIYRKTLPLFHWYSIYGTQSDTRERQFEGSCFQADMKKLILDFFVVFNSHDLSPPYKWHSQPCIRHILNQKNNFILQWPVWCDHKSHVTDQSYFQKYAGSLSKHGSRGIRLKKKKYQLQS